MLHSITDVHAHYDEAVFDTDRGEVLRTLREAGVCAIVNSGSSVPSSRRSLDLAKRFEGVYASVGVFPLEAYNVPSGWLEQISDMAEEDGCVAVGEIGLDYHLEDGAGPTYAQRETKKMYFVPSWSWRAGRECLWSSTTGMRMRTSSGCWRNCRAPG